MFFITNNKEDHTIKTNNKDDSCPATESTKDSFRDPTNGYFLKGAASPNPNGRPVQGGLGSGKPISGLRRSLTSLRRLEPKALELLEISMMEKEEFEECLKLGIKSEVTKNDFTSTKPPTKNQLDSAKFVIKQIESLTKGSVSDEIAIMNLRKLVNDEDDVVVSEQQQQYLDTDKEPTKRPMFSLTMSEDQITKYEKVLAEARGDDD